ncbi:MAG: acyl-ACP--UDP-N-acetylglucosamine O-acyltransferase [Planctomycetes bacterium]|nr:acyl-ACP--UDP-N-acetylglucosamine O-acyltransferase [Planctomycetota bacterium]
MSADIHPTAIIEPGAVIGEGVKIGPYAFIGSNVTLGNNCRIHHRATITGKTTMGQENEVHPGAVIGGTPQDLKFAGEAAELIIGDRNNFRENVTVNIGTAGGGNQTIIGNDCLFMAYVHIAHDCILKDRVVVANSAQIAGHVHIGEGAIISGLVGIHHFATVGRLSFIGGASGVTRDVPPFLLFDGDPARPRSVNVVGLKRNGITPEAIAALKKAYRTLYRSDLSRSQAIEKIEDCPTAGLPEIQELLESFRQSEAGRHGRALEATRSDTNGGMYKNEKTKKPS